MNGSCLGWAWFEKKSFQKMEARNCGGGWFAELIGKAGSEGGHKECGLSAA